MLEKNEQDERLDQATRKRLARLRTLPVDTSMLEARLLKELGARRDVPTMRLGWLRPIRSVAAAVFIFGLIASLLISTAGGPVLASPSQMASLHEELVSGKASGTPTLTIEEANRAINEQSHGSAELSSAMPDHAMLCCMKSLKGKRVACALLEKDGVPVSMTIANAADMSLPKSSGTNRGGVTYRVQSCGTLNMVMTERHGRWLCLVGEVQSEKLIDVAALLRF